MSTIDFELEPPQSRSEVYLHAAIDETPVEDLPDPQSRMEKLLYKLVESGGGEIQPATPTRLGGVKIGEGINVTPDGTISIEGGLVDDVLVNGESVVSDKIANIEVPSLDGYATETYVDLAIASAIGDAMGGEY